MKPRRSVLSVPGHKEKMHIKACNSLADVIMLDMEDSVPLDAKINARTQIISSLKKLNWDKKLVTVRINSLDTPLGYRDLLEIAEKAGDLINSIVIPKVNHPKHVHCACLMLDGIEMNKGFMNKIGIEASIETAQGMENISSIAKASDRLKTLVFGIADYSASVGASLVSLSGHGEQEETIYPGHRWHYALSRIVMAAKSHGLMAIDAPYGHFKDKDGAKKSAIISCALGCDGKWVIHPDQIDIINEVFTPYQEDIERAAKVIEAFETAENNGSGAVAVEGRMIDHATYRLATKLWEQAQYMNIV